MATNTTNYNLIKPDLNEFADIQVINNNMDVIDSELKKKDNKIGILSNLTTTEKTNLVGAVNEVDADLQSHKSDKAKHSKSATIIISAYNCKYPYDADYTCTGTNDEVIIQTALNSLPTVGGKVVFTEGNFNILSSIIVPKKPIVFQGCGNSTVFTANGDFNIFLLNQGDDTDWYDPYAQSNISFQNMKFTAEVLGSAGICLTAAVFDVRISQCYFEKLAKGINFDNVKAYSVSIDNNTFISNMNSIHCFNAVCHDFRITNNKESGAEHVGYDAESRHFIYMRQGECFEWLIEHNSIEHISNTSGLGVAIDLGADRNADIIISENSIEGCDAAIRYTGNFLYEGQKLSNLKVSNNSFRGISFTVYITGFGEILADGNMFLACVEAFIAKDYTGHIHTRNNLLNETLPENRYIVEGTTSSNVYNSNDIIVEDGVCDKTISYALTSNKSIYVATTGNDLTGKGTVSAPFATIQKALSAIPKNLNGYNPVIYISEGNYSLNDYVLNGYYGGTIKLTKNGTNKPTLNITTRFDIKNSQDVVFNNIKLQGSAKTGNIYIICANVEFNTCEFNSLAEAVDAYQNAKVTLNTVVFTGNNKCLISNYASNIGCYALSGSSNDVAYTSTLGGGIGVSGSSLSATTMYSKDNGWIIDGNVFK